MPGFGQPWITHGSLGLVPPRKASFHSRKPSGVAHLSGWHGLWQDERLCGGCFESVHFDLGGHLAHVSWRGEVGPVRRRIGCLRRRRRNEARERRTVAKTHTTWGVSVPMMAQRNAQQTVAPTL